MTKFVQDLIYKVSFTILDNSLIYKISIQSYFKINMYRSKLSHARILLKIYCNPNLKIIKYFITYSNITNNCSGKLPFDVQLYFLSEMEVRLLCL